MKAHTRIMHETLIRLAKGIITAYERWLLAEIEEGSKKALDSEKD